MQIKIAASSICFSRSLQKLCRCPYYGHPRGCPNYGRKSGCPPQALLLDGVIDLSKEAHVIFTTFDVGAFADRMAALHPAWRQHPRQLYNPRLWQPTARKEHRQEIAGFKHEHRHLIVTSSPEAHGVDVTRLMHDIGIELNWSWPPPESSERLVYLVSLAGHQAD